MLLAVGLAGLTRLFLTQLEVCMSHSSVLTKTQRLGSRVG
jgi:hypothetical protein